MLIRIILTFCLSVVVVGGGCVASEDAGIDAQASAGNCGVGLSDGAYQEFFIYGPPCYYGNRDGDSGTNEPVFYLSMPKWNIWSAPIQGGPIAALGGVRYHFIDLPVNHVNQDGETEAVKLVFVPESWLGLVAPRAADDTGLVSEGEKNTLGWVLSRSSYPWYRQVCETGYAPGPFVATQEDKKNCKYTMINHFYRFYLATYDGIKKVANPTHLDFGFGPSVGGL